MLNYILTGWLAASKLTLPPIPAIAPLTLDYNSQNDEGLGGSCYCLHWAKAQSGHGVAAYSASQHPVNLDRPVRNALILMYSGSYGHAGYVTNYTDDTVTLREVGWIGCDTVDERTLSRGDARIRGYWY